MHISGRQILKSNGKRIYAYIAQVLLDVVMPHEAMNILKSFSTSLGRSTNLNNQDKEVALTHESFK